MMKKFSQARKAVREKILRKERQENRRFNDPLKLFIERKYKEIFKEYQELYKVIAEENPGRRDYTTSNAFRKWLDSHPERNENMNSPSKNPLLVPEIVLEPISFLSTTKETSSEQRSDVLTQTIGETLNEAVHTTPHEEIPEEPFPNQLPQVNDFELANQIINELIADEELRNFIEEANINTDNDEGIELNIYEEINMDIEPFNYDLEVEPFEF